MSPESDSLAAYWEQPGRAILDFGLSVVPSPPQQIFDENEANVIAFVGEHRDDIVDAHKTKGRRVESAECVLNKRMDWGLLERYFRTWSSLTNYLVAHPEERRDRDADGGESRQPDIVVRFLGRLQEEMKRSTGSVPESVLVEWPTTVLLYRKRM